MSTHTHTHTHTHRNGHADDAQRLTDTVAGVKALTLWFSLLVDIQVPTSMIDQ